MVFQEEIRAFRLCLNERRPQIEDSLVSGRQHLTSVGNALLKDMQLNPSDASGNDSSKKTYQISQEKEFQLHIQNQNLLAKTRGISSGS